VHCEGFRIYNYYCCNATTYSWLCSSITHNIYYFIFYIYIHYDTKSNIPNLVATYGTHTAAHKGR